MFKVIVARTLLGLGIICLFAGLVTEVQATITSNMYCWKTDSAHCGYHPCTCEDGTTVFGCAAALTHGGTGWCYSGSPSQSCTSQTTHCGKKVTYLPPASCTNCNGVPNQVDCNKFHDCTTL